MNVSQWMRQSHRYISIVFILAVIITTFAAATGEDTESVLYYLPLPLLLLLIVSGLYLFALPYVSRWRRRESSRG